VQSTVDICSIYDAGHAKGAEHRNIDTFYLYYFGALHLITFYQFFYYKYFAALPRSMFTFFTKKVFQCSESDGLPCRHCPFETSLPGRSRRATVFFTPDASRRRTRNFFTITLHPGFKAITQLFQCPGFLRFAQNNQETFICRLDSAITLFFCIEHLSSKNEPYPIPNLIYLIRSMNQAFK